MTDMLTSYATRPFPGDLSVMEREQAEIRGLIRQTGINPWATYPGAKYESYLSLFVRMGNVHGALAMLPSDTKHPKRGIDTIFHFLLLNLEASPDLQRIAAVGKGPIFRIKTRRPDMVPTWHWLNQKLIYELLKRGIRPADSDLLEMAERYALRQNPGLPRLLARRARVPAEAYATLSVNTKEKS